MDWKKFTESPQAQALFAFLRVTFVTLVACWVNAGMPLREFVLAEFWDWAELSVQTGAALVIANFLGPWEQRYGLKVKPE